MRGTWRLSFPGTAGGEDVLTVELQGFRTYRRSGIVLRIGDHVSLDIQLEVGKSRNQST